MDGLVEPPVFILKLLDEILEADMLALEVLERWEEEDLIPDIQPLAIALERMIDQQQELDLSLLSLITPMTDVLRSLYGPGRLTAPRASLWATIAQDAVTFWHLTGETPHSLHAICEEFQQAGLCPKAPKGVESKDAILLMFIYLRKYPPLHDLANLAR